MAESQNRTKTLQSDCEDLKIWFVIVLLVSLDHAANEGGGRDSDAAVAEVLEKSNSGEDDVSDRRRRCRATLRAEYHSVCVDDDQVKLINNDGSINKPFSPYLSLCA
ncbi:hypothetical protein U1Q18_015879 [Sarracenia purpurea var. burkii]